jgi:predicted transcriptional regulator
MQPIDLQSQGQPSGSSSMNVADQIIAILENSPYGLTTEEIAQRMGTTSGNISSRLSKLVAYGVIHRTWGRPSSNAGVRAIYGMKKQLNCIVTNRFPEKPLAAQTE